MTRLLRWGWFVLAVSATGPAPQLVVPTHLVLRIETDKAQTEVSPSFASVAIDVAQATGGIFWGPADGEPLVRVSPLDLSSSRLRALSRPLAPAWLRIGGTDADRLYYDLGADPVQTPPPGYNAVLDAPTWEAIHAFARDVGFRVMFTLNAGPGPRNDDGEWQPQQAEALLEYTRAHGLDVGLWELGNEVNAYPIMNGSWVSGRELARDARTARRVLDETFPDARLAASSSAFWPVVGEVRSFYDDFLSHGGSDAVDVLTWHYYPQQSVRCPVAIVRAHPNTLLDTGRLRDIDRWAGRVESLRAEYAPDARVWLGETGNALCGGEPGVSDAFAGSLWWLDTLGRMARRGQQVVVRQTLVGSNYGLLDEQTLEPNPDYWATVLWKRFMGTRVLDVAPQPAREDLRTYAHCDASRSGGVSVLLINLNADVPAHVRVPGLGSHLELYGVGATGLSARHVALNGVPLAASEGRLPELDPRAVSADDVPVPPLSYALVRSVAAAVPACR